MIITIQNQTISVTRTEELVSGSKELYTAEFIFDSTWDEYERIAVFVAGATRIDVPLENNTCTIPWEVLTRTAGLTIGVYGIAGTKIKPTLWAQNIRVKQGAYGEGNAPQPPANTIYEQILNRLSEIDDTTYIHEQNMPSNIWTIYHGLQKYPSVSVTDSGGTQVHGEVVYIDDNTVEVRFNATFSGKAYLN